VPRCPDFDDVDCGFGRGGGAPFEPDADLSIPLAEPGFCGDLREKSGIPRGDFFFMEPPFARTDTVSADPSSIGPPGAGNMTGDFELLCRAI
jgi:hypothetical protein